MMNPIPTLFVILCVFRLCHMRTPFPNMLSWQWQLSDCDTNFVSTYEVQVYDIDLFDIKQSDIDSLRARNIKVVCYFSAGSYEDWRTDESQFPESAKGNDMSGWPGEKYVDIRDSTIRTIMTNRIILAKSKKCHAVEVDNIDTYTANTGFPLTANDQLDYNKFLAAQAHANDLSISLKNDAEQVDELVSHFDFVVVESCDQYSECHKYCPFVEQNKAVLSCSYSGNITRICNQHNTMGISTIRKNTDLEAEPFTSCIKDHPEYIPKTFFQCGGSQIPVQNQSNVWDLVLKISIPVIIVVGVIFSILLLVVVIFSCKKRNTDFNKF